LGELIREQISLLKSYSVRYLTDNLWFKSGSQAEHWWLALIIPFSWKAKVRRIVVPV
jgi:hypothetical protein